MYATGQGTIVDRTAAGTTSEDLTEGSFASNSGWWSDDSDEGERHSIMMGTGTTKLPPPPSETMSSYLDKLYCMLESCPATVVSWSRHGTAFAVYNRDVFETTVLPHYMSPVKFDRFVRQLTSYGFRKAKYTVNGMAVWEFRHPNFVKGHQQQTIIRRRGRGPRGAPEVPAARLNRPPDRQLKSALIDMMAVVRNLKTELADTKALVIAYARLHHGNKE
ncbi:hypothetical protein DYB28_001959 [Aphanomyces astaci]|uniref:HSF-type DNA-binding domain-containing protein n=1 Tax=Aphanomyces astaci TaxID=112090 RepID=A0A3L6VEM7_APHAT|nr:hypothetical protein DYB26_007168 [Aphanomyces astaci]RLO07179.1 hypothetical protein DYB28_001959 [Aphanomyces astaci]